MATLIYLTVIGESHGGLPPARLASIAEAWPGADASEGKTREIFGCCLMSAYTPTARLTCLRIRSAVTSHLPGEVRSEDPPISAMTSLCYLPRRHSRNGRSSNVPILAVGCLDDTSIALVQLGFLLGYILRAAVPQGGG